MKKVLYPEGLHTDAVQWLKTRMLSESTAEFFRVRSCGLFLYFPYFINERLFRVMYRNLSKKGFSYSDPLFAGELPFWGQRHFEDKSYLIITEGQIDAMSVYEFSNTAISNVVSLPNGTGSVSTSFENNYEFLQQFEKIYLCFDTDRGGLEAVEKAKKLLPAHKTKIITVAYNDVNEMHMSHGNNSDAYKEFLNNINYASYVKEPFIHNAKNFDPAIFDEPDFGASTGFYDLDQMLGGWRLGEITTITADTGCGKTTFTLQMMVGLATRGEKVWVNSPEMKAAIIQRKIASQIVKKNLRKRNSKLNKEEIAKYREFMDRDVVYCNFDKEPAPVETLEKVFEKARLIYGIKYFMIDHLEYISNLGNKKSEYENINHAMISLHVLAVRLDIHIFLIVHPSKTIGNEKVKMNSIKGSSSIKQYSDNVLILHRTNRNKDEEESDLGQFSNKKNVTMLTITKNRFLGSEGSIKLTHINDFDVFEETL